MNKLLNLFLRYILIFLVGLGNLFIFYKIFTPLTIKTTGFFLNLASKAVIIENTIIFKTLIIEMIPACIAGAAYYFLFILIFSTPDIKFLKRILILVFSLILFFILNTSRILILIFLKNNAYFTALHTILWYAFSTVFVILIWLLCVKIFKIKKIPVYSDIKFLKKSIKKSKRHP
jgi:exosortase/archaeosortase family protein